MFCLQKHLHEPIRRMPLIELLVQLIRILQIYPMSDKRRHVDFALDNHLQNVRPIFLNRALAVTDEADAALHERADVDYFSQRY